MSGDWLTLGAIGALALGGLAKRGSRAKPRGRSLRGPERPRPAVKRSARALRAGLGIADVRIGDGTIYLMSAPKRLEALLTVHDVDGNLLRSSAWKLEAMLRAVRVAPMTIDSYVRNATHWYGLYEVVSLFMQESGAQVNPQDENDWWRVRVVPTPGSPPEPTWSAKLNKIVPPEPVEPFRFCEAGPTVWMGKSPTPALVQFGELDRDGYGAGKGRKKFMLPPMFLSHGVDIGDLKAVEQCGGFLWPSFALTWRQPASYGDVVFLAPIAVLTRALTTKKSPFYLAGTDIWSPTARELIRRQAEITEQLRGQSDRIHQNDLLLSSSAEPSWDNMVGNMSTSFGGDWTQTDKITKRSDLTWTLRKIMADHVVDDDPYVYPPRPEWDSQGEHRYPYAELKVLGVVPVRSMVACFYPRKKARRVNAFLDRQNFAGFRVSFDWQGPMSDEATGSMADRDAMRRQWGSMVTSAILAWAARPCVGRNIRLGDVVASPGLRRSSSDYRAVLHWRSRGQPYVEHGFCGTKK